MIDSALFDVPCPHCGAGPLELCQTNGRYMESTVHGPRRIRAGVDLKPEPIAGPARPTIIGRNDPDKCRAGIHDWTEANVYTSPTGNRQCRPCRRDTQRALRGNTHKNGGTHCRQGHEYTPENTYQAPKGGPRRCITCRNIQHAKTKARKKAA